MADRRRKGDQQPRSPVVRRPRDERKRLDPSFEPLAHGETDRIRGPRRRPRLDDRRPRFLVPGVANRDARLVYDVRTRALEEARDRHLASPGDLAARADLAAGLRDARALGLWRGRSVTGFDAFVEQVLGLDARDAAALADEAPGADVERLSNESIAVWMRVEAALIEGEVDGSVSAFRGEDGVERVRFETESVSFPLAADVMHPRLAPLARDVTAQRPRSPGGGPGRDRR